MHTAQTDVERFHEACDVPVHRQPAIRRPELRARLIMEEAAETARALTGKAVSYRVDDVVTGSLEAEPASLVEAIDGMCDVLVVTYGTAAELGVDIEPFWNEVHRTNMLKANGPVRADGKRLKPEGWQPPRIAEILATYG